MLEAMLKEYRRHPGLEHLVRLYPSSLGVSGFKALERALTASERYVTVRDWGFVELRSGLYWFLKRRLQQSLIEDGQASQAMRDDYFAADLGL
ncbi:hypothetical protein RA263_08525 [Pseudomonas syringae pv. tagetis]